MSLFARGSIHLRNEHLSCNSRGKWCSYMSLLALQQRKQLMFLSGTQQQSTAHCY